MHSPEFRFRLRIAPLFVAVLSLLLFSSVSASPVSRAPPRPPAAAAKSSSSTPFSSTALHSITSSPHSSLSSSIHPTPIFPSSTSLPQPTAPPTSHTSSSSSSSSSSRAPSGTTFYGSTWSLSRMLGLVFVSVLFVVVVISFVWYFWRRQWAAQRRLESQPLSDDGWLRVDEGGRVVRDDVVHQVVTPYQPSMMAYMAPSPTPAALTISYQPHVDISSERHFVRF